MNLMLFVECLSYVDVIDLYSRLTWNNIIKIDNGGLVLLQLLFVFYITFYITCAVTYLFTSYACSIIPRNTSS